MAGIRAFGIGFRSTHLLSMPSTLEPSTTLDSVQVEALSQSLQSCRAVCGNCADAWLARSPLSSEALRCIRMIVDCADLCAAAGELLPFYEEANPIVLRGHLVTCAVSCERAARELLRSGQPNVTACVSACSNAATGCRRAISLLPAATATAA
jgi:hypothetical protein